MIFAKRSLTMTLIRRLLAVAVVLTVGHLSAAQTVIVDNEDAGFSILSNSWTLTNATPGHWGASYRYRSTTGLGSSFGEVEFRPNLPVSGDYRVSTYYTQGNNRAIDAPFTVHHADGGATVEIDQQISGSTWVSLGVFSFDAGTGGRVTLSNDAGPNVVIADAVRFQYIDPAAPSFRAFWADAFHEGFKSQAQIDQMVNRAATGNYNAIIAEVLAYHDDVGVGHGAYWDSAIVPRAGDIIGSFDPLEYLCTAAHAQGIEVHAWLVGFRGSTSWPPSGNTLLANHPEWFMVPQADINSANTLGQPTAVAGRYTLDPGSPDVQEYLVSILREWIENYDIDGVNWDYIRYIVTDAGYPADANYAKSSLARFQQITGTASIPPPTGNTAWNDFRRRTIDEMIRRAYGELLSDPQNAVKPLRHTGDMIGFGGPPSGCNFALTDAYLLHQNWVKWIERGWLDAAITMGYKREACSSNAADYRGWVDCSLNNWRTDRHVYSGQGNYLNSLPESFVQMQYAIDQGADGSVNFSYWATEGVYTDDCGSRTSINNSDWYNQVADQVFTSPAPVPQMPWRDPAISTQGVVWGQVTDAVSADPIDDATVEIPGVAEAQTDANGIYLIARVPALPDCGGHSLIVSKAGYSPKTVSNIVVLGALLRRQNVSLGGASPVADNQGDVDGNGVVDLADLRLMICCVNGPMAAYDLDDACLDADFDDDLDVDVADLAQFQRHFTLAAESR